MEPLGFADPLLNTTDLVHLHSDEVICRAGLGQRHFSLKLLHINDSVMNGPRAGMKATSQEPVRARIEVALCTSGEKERQMGSRKRTGN